MIPIFVDYETYWETGYTLTRMTPLEYLHDERFELQTASTVVGNSDQVVYTVGEQETGEYLRSLPLDNAMLIAHNGNEFDHMISAWKLGLEPRMWGDTLAMARPHHAKVEGLGLAALAKVYSTRSKGSLETVGTKGKRLVDFTSRDHMLMRAYNDEDVLILRDIFRGLYRKTGVEELKHIDIVARMLLEPQFETNVDLLERGLSVEVARKKKQLMELGRYLSYDENDLSTEELVRATCASQPRFKKLIESLGVECPMKQSPTNPVKQIPALAKTDVGMAELCEHEDPVVRAAANARLGVKSTQLETRINRFLNVASMFGGKMPIALRYSGADTTMRNSGTFGMNQQNLPRVNPKNKRVSDVLRYSLRAPEGYVVVVADLSAIELRVNHFLWQEDDTMDKFNADPEADVYKSFAAHELYGTDESEVTKLQRFVGKVAQLQLGYYSGAAKLQDAARIMSDGEVLLDYYEAKHVVDTWRAKYNKIVEGWRLCGEALGRIEDGRQMMPLDEWGLCVATKHGIKTPKAAITYPQLHQREVERFGRAAKQWYYKSSRGWKGVHGGVVDENICQHLAGQVKKDAILRFHKSDAVRHCLRPHIAHEVHDEIIAVAKAKHANEVLDAMQAALRTRPEWWPELVVWSEGDIASCYGKAK